MSDGWSDAQKRPLLNVIIICDSGPMFLKAIDALGEIKDKHLISKLLKEVIDEVGYQNVIQVITDNALKCKVAGEIIEKKLSLYSLDSMCCSHPYSCFEKYFC